MDKAYNGIPAGRLSIAWQKSARSNPSGNCVEMAALPEGQGIAVRNSRDPQGPALVYTMGRDDRVHSRSQGRRLRQPDHRLGPNRQSRLPVIVLSAGLDSLGT